MTERHTPDGRTAYLEAGAGRPLVLLHAFPLCKDMWRPQLDALGSVARVLAPDFPGFGGSAGFDGPPSVDHMADGVARFLDGLRVTEPVVLGGLSMGGYVALAFARRHATRLRALILADTKADPDDDAAKANRDKTIALATESGARAVIEQLLPRLLGTDTRAQRPDVVESVRLIASAQSATAIADALRALRDRPDARPGLAAIAVPTTVLVGDQDSLTPPEKAREMAASIRGARVVVLAGAGHLSNMEKAAEFNEVVRDFIAGHS